MYYLLRYLISCPILLISRLYPTVGRGKTDELILDAINKRGFPDDQDAGSEMIKQAAEGIGLAQPTKITASNVIEPMTTSALRAGTLPQDTVMGKLLQKTAEKMGGTPIKVRSGENAGNIWMEVDISY